MQALLLGLKPTPAPARAAEEGPATGAELEQLSAAVRAGADAYDRAFKASYSSPSCC